MIPRSLLALLLTAAAGTAQAPSGRWEGTITIDDLKVPFTILFESGGGGLSASFVNGDTRVTSRPASFEEGKLLLSFEPAGTQMRATLENGELNGDYGTGKTAIHRFTASAYCTCSYEGEAGPVISGEWQVPEAGWRLAIRRVNEDTLVTVSRPGGGLGPLTGRFDGLTFMLRYFDGSRAAVLEIEPRKDEGLDLVWKEPGQAPRKLKAVRSTPR